MIFPRGIVDPSDCVGAPLVAVTVIGGKSGCEISASLGLIRDIDVYGSKRTVLWAYCVAIADGLVIGINRTDTTASSLSCSSFLQQTLRDNSSWFPRIVCYCNVITLPISTSSVRLFALT